MLAPGTPDTSDFGKWCVSKCGEYTRARCEDNPNSPGGWTIWLDHYRCADDQLSVVAMNDTYWGDAGEPKPFECGSKVDTGGCIEGCTCDFEQFECDGGKTCGPLGYCAANETCNAHGRCDVVHDASNCQNHVLTACRDCGRCSDRTYLDDLCCAGTYVCENGLARFRCKLKSLAPEEVLSPDGPREPPEFPDEIRDPPTVENPVTPQFGGTDEVRSPLDIPVCWDTPAPALANSTEAKPRMDAARQEPPAIGSRRAGCGCIAAPGPIIVAPWGLALLTLGGIGLNACRRAQPDGQ